ncbi:hypothetical protein KAJ87_00275 [Candidatus Pacearchaeota archaeon]|nr:hypothetical protein [Candidatus Pacearchaeota archaeon]
MKQKYLQERTLKYLQERTLNKIIDYFQVFMVNETFAPSIEGKKIFFNNVMKRDNFFPKPVQNLINKNQGHQNQEDYLRSHASFNTAFSKYFY